MSSRFLGGVVDACQSLAAPLAEKGWQRQRTSQPAVQPRPLAELSAEIRAAVEKVEQGLGSSPRKQRKGWNGLLELLEQLAGALRQSGHAAAAEVEKLLGRGQEMFDGLGRGGKDPVDSGPAKEYLSSITRLLESIRIAPQPGPDREKFWT